MPGGVRMGAPALTSRGFTEDDFVQVANFVDRSAFPPVLFCSGAVRRLVMAPMLMHAAALMLLGSDGSRVIKCMLLPLCCWLLSIQFCNFKHVSKRLTKYENSRPSDPLLLLLVGVLILYYFRVSFILLPLCCFERLGCADVAEECSQGHAALLSLGALRLCLPT